MQIQPRAPQDLPLTPDDAPTSSTSMQPSQTTMTRTRSRPPFFVSVTCAPSSTASNCSSDRSSSSAADFASQAVWGVVITTLIVAVLLVVMLIYVKRRVRRRNRERIRGLLWELVQAVQEGRVDESRLQQALYGVDPAFMKLKTPVMYEVCLDNPNPSDLTSKSVLLEKSSLAHWDQLIPLSTSHPRHLAHNIPKGKTSDTRTRISLGKKPQAQSMEKQLDISVLVVMPHERKEPVSPPQSTSSLRMATTDSVPLTIATASPTFQENPENPVVSTERPRRRVDALSSVSAAARAQQRANNEADLSDHPTHVGDNPATR
ncbi:hypothetical protein CPB86DRAFT_874627 [Serendipita vermifera]|nr:hypothetical protein CPB86DRAFT_874627 [Serendipita vermifera]